MATPWIAATTGLPSASIAAISSRKLGEATDFGVLNSRISAPAQNARPAPASTTAFTDASAAARARCRMSASRSACASVFIGGLSRRMTATAPSTAYCAALMRAPGRTRSRRRLAEVRLAHLRVAEQRPRLAGEDDAAAFHDVGAARELERRARVLLDQQD